MKYKITIGSLLVYDYSSNQETTDTDNLNANRCYHLNKEDVFETEKLSKEDILLILQNNLNMNKIGDLQFKNAQKGNFIVAFPELKKVEEYVFTIKPYHEPLNLEKLFNN